jgi:dTDP-glucose pyrophosphorylase
MIESSSIIWVNQSQHKGFGDAVLKAKSFISDEDFLVLAGDTYITSENGEHLQRLSQVHNKNNADISLLTKEVSNPKNYGVIEIIREGDNLKVTSAVEKPAHPKSRWAIMPTYIFYPSVFNTLQSLKPGINGEVQLTDAINNQIKSNSRVYAVQLHTNEIHLDIGTPESYLEAIKSTLRILD